MTGRFVLIDHSVVRVGGHNLEYDQRVLRAAAERGLRCILLTARNVDKQTIADNVHAEVIPRFSDNFFALNEHFFFAGVGYYPEALRAGDRLPMFPPVPPASDRARRGARDFHKPGFILKELSRLDRVIKPFALYIGTTFWSPELPTTPAGLRVRTSPISRAPGLLAKRQRAWLSRLTEPVRVAVKRISLLMRSPAILMALAREIDPIKRFSAELGEALADLRPSATDVIFLPTMHFGELLACRLAMSRDPRLVNTQWRFVFRREIVENIRDVMIEGAFEALRPRVSILRWFNEHAQAENFKFFTDTEPLARQYGSFAPAMFTTIPIPVQGHQILSTQADATRPLVVAFPGDMRDEKGSPLLYGLAEEFLPRSGEPPQVRFKVQSNLGSPDQPGRSSFALNLLRSARFPHVELVEGPLRSDEYRDFIANSDIVVVPYELRNYRARSSGVMIEALAMGVPVIVPAATWMHELLEAFRQRHFRKMLREVEGEASYRERKLQDPQGTGPLTVRVHESLVAECDLLFVTFQAAGWEDLSRGEVLIDYEFELPDRSILKRRDCLHFGAGERLISLVSVPDAARALSISAAWPINFLRRTNTPLAVDRIAGVRLERAVPSSAGGMAYIVETDLGQTLRAMMKHHKHYKTTMAEIAPEIADLHSPERLVSDLLGIARCGH